MVDIIEGLLLLRAVRTAIQLSLFHSRAHFYLSRSFSISTVYGECEAKRVAVQARYFARAVYLVTPCLFVGTLDETQQSRLLRRVVDSVVFV